MQSERSEGRADGADEERHHQRRPRTDPRFWRSAVPAASGLCYTEASRAFTSWLTINQFLIAVAFKELPQFFSLVRVLAALKAQRRLAPAHSGSRGA